ncbi:hypothetical protein KQX54_007223 [Cotesia glomerata]|uniref:Uncharacterized protein n=1 Tax=Cotesia glomerata TaxID=32391 RepID=A0AAV7HWM4_COTGL|nr:hypothetical protein KQX54_007223 [Cotesia glomerata]
MSIGFLGLLYFILFKSIGLLPWHFNYMKIFKWNPALHYYNYGFSTSLLGTYWNVLYSLGLAYVDYCYMVYFPEILPKKIGVMIVQEQKLLQCASLGIENYYQHDKCYGYKGANCIDSSECLSTAYECRSGICQEARNATLKGVECSAKYDKTVCWVPGTISNRRYALEAYKFPLGPVEYVCRVNKNGVTVLGKVVKALFHSNTCKYIWKGEASSSSDFEVCR